MSKRSRRPADDDEVVEDRPATQCTTLDHIYPDTKPGTKCLCGKRTFRPFIQEADLLKEGMIIRTYWGGPLYEVEMVNQSRARCRLITAQAALDRRKTDRVFMPMPGMPVPEDVIADVEDEEEEEKRGRVINISPRSVAIRVSAAELEAETQSRSEGTMAMKNVAALPVAGKSGKQREAERRAKLAQKPNGHARPLTGAAAKAKANAGSRPKVAKTVRKCGCGCGGETMAYFVPGHDARYKGWMKKLGTGELTQPELQKLMGKQYGKYTWKKSGAGFAPKETYQEAAEA